MLLSVTRGVLATMSVRTAVSGSQAFGHLCSKARASSGISTGSSAHIQTDQRPEVILQDMWPFSPESYAMAQMGSTQTVLALAYVW